MRSILIFVGFLMLLRVSDAQSLQVDFTSKPESGGQFSPKHILAVWVETSNNVFVSSLIVKANKRIGYLSEWNKNSSGSKTNAVTGATISSAQSQSVLWDCKNAAGQLVSKGDYKLFIESTSHNGTGPLSEISFTIGDDSYSSSPASATNYTNLVLKYTPAASSVESILQVDESFLNCYPNPVKESTIINYILINTGDIQLDIYNINGKRVFHVEKNETEGNHSFEWNAKDMNGNILPSGNYYCVLSSKDYKISSKIIIE